MGIKLKYDSSSVDRSKTGSIEPPKAGVYPMVIKEAKYEKGSAGKGDRIVFVLRLNDKSSKSNGYQFWDYVNLEIDWKVDQYLQAALGIDTEKKKSGSFDVDDFLNKSVRGRVKADTYQGEYRPKLASVLPPEDVEDDEDDDDLDDEIEDLDEDEDEDEDESDDEDDEFEDDEDDEDDEDEDEEPAPVAKKSSSKAAPAKAKKAKRDYEEMEVDELDELLEDRDLPVKGSRTAKIARLRKYDADPFS